MDSRHNFLFEAYNIWRPDSVEHLALPQGRAGKMIWLCGLYLSLPLFTVMPINVEFFSTCAVALLKDKSSCLGPGQVHFWSMFQISSIHLNSIEALDRSHCFFSHLAMVEQQYSIATIPGDIK